MRAAEAAGLLLAPAELELAERLLPHGDCWQLQEEEEDETALPAGPAHGAEDGAEDGAAGEEAAALKRGLLWAQRERLFARWKLRYCVLTRDYLHCFKRAESRISHMGQFLFKLRLAEAERVEWVQRRSGSAVRLALGRGGRVLLRAADGLHDWFQLLEACARASRERRRLLRAAGAAPAVGVGCCGSLASRLEDWRGSVLSELEAAPLPIIDSPPPSVPASFRGAPACYRLNSDVFFLSAAPAGRAPGEPQGPEHGTYRSQRGQGADCKLAARAAGGRRLPDWLPLALPLPLQLQLPGAGMGSCGRPPPAAYL